MDIRFRQFIYLQYPALRSIVGTKRFREKISHKYLNDRYFIAKVKNIYKYVFVFLVFMFSDFLNKQYFCVFRYAVIIAECIWNNQHIHYINT